MGRYVKTIDFFVWADSQKEADEQAEQIAKELRDKYDNKADIVRNQPDDKCKHDLNITTTNDGYKVTCCICGKSCFDCT